MDYRGSWRKPNGLENPTGGAVCGQNWVKQLGPPAKWCRLLSVSFLGEGSPTNIDYRKKELKASRENKRQRLSQPLKPLGKKLVWRENPYWFSVFR